MRACIMRVRERERKQDKNRKIGREKETWHNPVKEYSYSKENEKKNALKTLSRNKDITYKVFPIEAHFI